MWDGILPVAAPRASSPIALKGRDSNGHAVADGSTPLPEECFVAMNRFSVRQGSAEAFEQRWAERESSLQVSSTPHSCGIPSISTHRICRYSSRFMVLQSQRMQKSRLAILFHE